MLFLKINPKLDLYLNLKNKSFNIANMPKYGYICRALSKISKLALAGYNSQQAYSSIRTFFVRNISMRPHIHYVELGRDIFGCAGHLLSLSANPFKLHTNHLAVICEAPLNQQECINHV